MYTRCLRTLVLLCKCPNMLPKRHSMQFMRAIHSSLRQPSHVIDPPMLLRPHHFAAQASVPYLSAASFAHCTSARAIQSVDPSAPIPTRPSYYAVFLRVSKPVPDWRSTPSPPFPPLPRSRRPALPLRVWEHHSPYSTISTPDLTAAPPPQANTSPSQYPA